MIKICMIVGDPVAHSLSPAMHNAAYQSLGIETEYTFLAARVAPEDLPQCLDGVRAMSFRGLTCTIPHKQAVIALLDDLSSEAREIGAVNTVVNDNGRLVGYNTDWLGVVRPIEARRPLAGSRALVVGAGGTARAACYGLLRGGAKVTVANRTAETGERLAADFGLPFLNLGKLNSLMEFDIVLNTTPLGMGEFAQQTPIAADLFGPSQLVFDAVYLPSKTRMLTEAKQRGAQTIPGLEMLLHQGLEQFRLYTGRAAPESVMREVLERRANENLEE